MPLEGIRYTAKDMPNGQKARLVIDTETNQVLNASAITPKKLRFKARAKRKR